MESLLRVWSFKAVWCNHSHWSYSSIEPIRSHTSLYIRWNGRNISYWFVNEEEYKQHTHNILMKWREGGEPDALPTMLSLEKEIYQKGCTTIKLTSRFSGSRCIITPFTLLFFLPTPIHPFFVRGVVHFCFTQQSLHQASRHSSHLQQY